VLKWRIRLSLALIWLFTILFVTLTPGEKLPDTPDVIGFDKLVHLSMFLVLTVLWISIGNQNREKASIKKITTNYLVFGIFFAILVEYLQKYIPGRSFDYWDMVANLTGGAIGAVCFYILQRKHPNLV